MKPSEGLYFRAIEDIPAGSELLLCYGALYRRNYDINLDKSSGCGQKRFVEGFVSKDKKGNYKLKAALKKALPKSDIAMYEDYINKIERFRFKE